ncbi:DUF3060 domain-containing protein [Pseudofulvimonas gallinarii]|jgi:hypothetical protein|uniref:DUF3060 family protein n=1 Tax=Pseudofulvimonas gallinarii TaxID=634155 RepID=A0A4R3LM35_9GAMM|nr:DUF3060 domain-containing protein [Pseudofulvimonas gallinarii]TCS98886.1 DUF3060 family protein [Pseudofulvimonas gallinarii]THD14366.1 hypothetical protein B1808_03645 [Pseudofulvimonas gallinarii]
MPRPALSCSLRLSPVLALLLCLPVSAQDPDEAPPRTLRDPAEALPSRASGEAVMSSRDAFDREQPQFQIGRRKRSETPAVDATGAQLAGDDQSLGYACDIGERVELVGHRNTVDITGDCLGLSIVGHGNQVTIEVVDDIRIEGRDNDVRWQRGFTSTRPNALELGGRNSVRALADARDEGD